MKSLAAVVWKKGDPWSIEEVEIDPPGPNEVVVEWSAAGMCHSDESLRRGKRIPPEMEDVMYPMLGGHEGAGIVSDVGPGVTTLSIGDHVLPNFSSTCGKCRYCASGRGHLCNENKGFMDKGQLESGRVTHRARGKDLFVCGKLGTFAERTVLSTTSLVVIDGDLPLAPASLVSCGVSTGWGSAVERGGTRPGDVVVVVGLGGLGTSAVQGARVAGASRIIGVEPFAFRREMAEKLGATSTGATIGEVRQEIMDATNGQGADVVILTPTVVTGQLINEALDITGKGAVCVVTGMGPLGVTDVPIDIGAFALFHKELRGCLFGSLDPRAGIPRLLDLYRRGLLDLDSMVTTYPLVEINKAFADSDEGRIVRGVLTMNGLV